MANLRNLSGLSKEIASNIVSLPPLGCIGQHAC
ncbi:hypothetical protein CUMW_104160 [Citrus unshiu]|nr:hypothetical protein CUMW_104160 [Citrus unshiu]